MKTCNNKRHITLFDDVTSMSRVGSKIIGNFCTACDHCPCKNILFVVMLSESQFGCLLRDQRLTNFVKSNMITVFTFRIFALLSRQVRKLYQRENVFQQLIVSTNPIVT